MSNRRDFFKWAGVATAVSAAAVSRHALAAIPKPHSQSSAATKPGLTNEGVAYVPVTTLNGWTLPWRMKDGVKEFQVTGTDGGAIPLSARWSEVTTDIAVGQMRQIEFVADEEGDWAFHCHKSHHTMNAMGHKLPTMIGVEQADLVKKIHRLIPDYMAMGQHGMADMAEMEMPVPDNTLPMMTGQGPFGGVGMGGMFSVVKVRKDQAPGDYTDPGWYTHPPGTVASEYTGEVAAPVHSPDNLSNQKTAVEVQVRKPVAGHGGH